MKGLVGCLFYTVVILVCWFITAKLFAYSLWALFDKDAPFWADLIGGLILNGINLPLAFFCWLAVNVLGYSVPLIHLN